ncbi:hypothetical protein B0T21DRAFT_291123 [Apiosordaria backusii]|uniref:Rhodopsin domain-containing protein n=1 Tax=Apiosordaria backusii TaxID=314023 RepID=A0AA40EBR7_9PEZI|nr:hypothetical protein B0T21DRAFT_291123 [Apiosordaria backusii]
MDTIDAATVPEESLRAIIWTCFSTAFVLVALRTAVRARTSAPTVDDYCIFFALTCLLSLCVLETIQLPSLYYIAGVLAGTAPIVGIIEETERYLLFQFPIVILFWSTLWSVKAAFLALYWKIFRDLPGYRQVWYFLALFCLLAYGGCLVTLTVSCGGDVKNFFGFATCAKPEHVWASNFSVWFSTAVDVFTDLCIMAMPLQLIYDVKVTLRQKVGLIAVFGLGFVMIAFAIIRAKQVLVEKMFVNLTLLMIWSTLAASISVIVGTLPALKVLITVHSRNSANRSNQHSARGSKLTGKQSISKSVRMGSISKEKKSMQGSMDAMESQEEILVQHDVVSFLPSFVRVIPLC